MHDTTCRLGKNCVALARSFSPLMPCAGCDDDDGGLAPAPALVLTTTMMNDKIDQEKEGRINIVNGG